MKIIALQGKGNCGKTTTLLKLNSWFSDKINIKPFYYKTSRKAKCDIVVEYFVSKNTDMKIRNNVFNFPFNIKVGICTLGDYAYTTKKHEIYDINVYFKKFKEHNINIVFCACRSVGNTVKCIKEYAQGIKPDFITKTISKNITEQYINIANLKDFEQLLDCLIECLKTKSDSKYYENN